MPEDVPLGAGYIGDALFSRFPGQYRDPEMDQQQRAHFNSFPGNHGPAYTDPDSGRKLMLKEMPGIGQVVVPVDHTIAAVVPVEHTMAAVYPSDHTMVGLDGDEPNTDHGQMHWHKELVLALDQSASIPDSSRQLMVAFSQVSQEAVKRALMKAKNCRFESPAAGVEFIRAAIVASATHFKPIVVKAAIQIAERVSKAAAPAIKSVWCAPKPGVRKPALGKPRTLRPVGTGDWPGSMMGNIVTDAWNALTGKSQAWYTNVSQIQNGLSLVLSGVTAVGKDAWNQVRDSSQGPTQDGSDVSGVDDYDQVTSDIQARLSSIIVTKDHVPDDATIAAASNAVAQYNKQLTFVQQVSPGLVAQVQADQAKVQSMLPSTMKAPAGAAQTEFMNALDDRAKQLTGGVSDTLKYIGIGAAVLGGAWILKQAGVF